MIIEFNKKHNFYDDLKNDLYKEDFEKEVCYNFVPVEIYGVKYILTCSVDLDGYLTEYKNNVPINIYIKDTDNKILCVKHKLTNIVNFANYSNYKNKTFENKTFENKIEPDCFIDSICDLLLIKFNSSKLNYIKINNNLSCFDDLRQQCEKIKLKYVWTDIENNNIEQKILTKTTKVVNVWYDKYVNLPQVPYIIDVLKKKENKKKSPITGSSVYDSKSNFIGIVSFVDNNEIKIIPLICIKKICDYLNYSSLNYIYIETKPIKLDLKLGLNNINCDQGLLIVNNYYNNIIKNKNKIKKKIKTLQSDLFYENDDLMEIEKKDIAEKLNSMCFTEHESLKENEKNEIKENEKKEIEENLKKYLTLNNLLNQFKLININDNYYCLKKGNILCSIDNYKIDCEGNIIIFQSNNDVMDEKIIIPLKSYIWLFKNSTNNMININFISSNDYRGNLVKTLEETNEILLTDSFVKKQINLVNINIYADNNYLSNAIIDYGKIKYISCKKMKLIELDEKVLDIFACLLANNQKKYSRIINEIFTENENFTPNDGKKILITINAVSEIPEIKIVSNQIVNFDDFLNKYKTEREQKNFLINYA